MIIKELKTDERGRIFLSQKDRRRLGDVKKVMVKREGGQLFFYNEEEWTDFADKRVKGLKGIELRKMDRFLYTSGYLQDIDQKGRVFIPLQLMKQ